MMTDEASLGQTIDETRNWLAVSEISTLNIAGPRGSSDDGIYDDARAFLIALLTP